MMRDYGPPDGESSLTRVDVDSVLATLEDFHVLSTPAIGVVLYSAMHGPDSPLVRNLQVALAATTLDVTGLDRVRRLLAAHTPTERTGDPAREKYLEAFHLAKGHMERARASFVPKQEPLPSLGVYAASVALQRLHHSLVAAHLLYELGLGYEADTVARQVLEQIAWALEASRKSSHEELDAISPTKAITPLKRLVPEAGMLYNILSRSAHAGIAQHQATFSTDADGRGVISTGPIAWVDCAAVIMLLADAWVVTLETTQYGHIAISPEDDHAPLKQTQFLSDLKRIIDELTEIEGSG